MTGSIKILFLTLQLKSITRINRDEEIMVPGLRVLVWVLYNSLGVWVPLIIIWGSLGLFPRSLKLFIICLSFNTEDRIILFLNWLQSWINVEIRLSMPVLGHFNPKILSCLTKGINLFLLSYWNIKWLGNSFEISKILHKNNTFSLPDSYFQTLRYLFSDFLIMTMTFSLFPLFP